jgi:2-deoxy-D-gluconate 3-dehydrogenase
MMTPPAASFNPRGGPDIVLDLFDLTGRVAIVTGGNGGIGLGLARGLARAGASVAIVARDAAKSAAAVKSLVDEGLSAFAVEADVTAEAEVKRAVAKVVERSGAIHIVVNNAGTTVRKPPHEVSFDEWRRVLDVNLTSAFLTAKSCHPAMKRAGGGKVINIASLMSIFGGSYAPAYAASKGGLVQLTKSQALAWAPDNIQANAILPGWIDTELTRGARAQVPGLNERVLARTPQARWGTPDDLAGTAVWLASRASDFVTGSAVVVDGGYSSAS